MLSFRKELGALEGEFVGVVSCCCCCCSSRDSCRSTCSCACGCGRLTGGGTVVEDLAAEQDFDFLGMVEVLRRDAAKRLGNSSILLFVLAAETTLTLEVEILVGDFGFHDRLTVAKSLIMVDAMVNLQ
jgi:hypothetical protein